MKYFLLSFRVTLMVFVCSGMLAGGIGYSLPTLNVVQAVRTTLTAWPPPTKTAQSIEQVLVPIQNDLPQPSHTPLKPSNTTAELNKSTCLPAISLRQIGLVTKVVDGDTIEVLIDGQAYRVRYIGIDSPEPSNNDPESARWGELASKKNSELVEGQIVTLVQDISDEDRYGRLLRYVFVGDEDGLFVNKEMVSSGYAKARDYTPDLACSHIFRETEIAAREEKIGLWALFPMVILPPAERVVGLDLTPTVASGANENCDPAYPQVCIPPFPPDLDCSDIDACRFEVLPPDPHYFDGDGDGIGCERCP